MCGRTVPISRAATVDRESFRAESRLQNGTDLAAAQRRRLDGRVGRGAGRRFGVSNDIHPLHYLSCTLAAIRWSAARSIARPEAVRVTTRLEWVRLDDLEKVAFSRPLRRQDVHQLRQDVGPIEAFRFRIEPNAPVEVALELAWFRKDPLGRQEFR